MFSSVFSVYKVSLVVVVGSRALSDNADHNGHILMPRKSNSKLHSCIYESYCRDKPMSRMNRSNKILLLVKVFIFMYIFKTSMFRWLLDHYFRPGWRVIMNPHHAIILSKKEKRTLPNNYNKLTCPMVSQIQMDNSFYKWWFVCKLQSFFHWCQSLHLPLINDLKVIGNLMGIQNIFYRIKCL